MREIDIKKIWVIGIVLNILFFVYIASNSNQLNARSDSSLDAASSKIITIARTITLGVNSQDTLWMPINETIIPSNGVSNNPPDYAGWNGNGTFFIRKTSGSTADSIAVLLKPCDHHGNILKALAASNLDTLWVVGTAFTTYGNVGNGSTYKFPISQQFDPTLQIATIIKQGDKSGGSRSYELGIYKQ